MLLASCAAQSRPEIAPPDSSEFCTLVRGHQFSEPTLIFLDHTARIDAGVAADLDWITDVSKTQRCLCTADQTGCPE